MRLEQGQTIDR